MPLRHEGDEIAAAWRRPKSASGTVVAPIWPERWRISLCGSLRNSSSRPSSRISSSVEGWIVSPRKSRRKSACFSRTMTSMPARARRNPSIMPAGPPPAMQQRVLVGPFASMHHRRRAPPRAADSAVTHILIASCGPLGVLDALIPQRKCSRLVDCWEMINHATSLSSVLRLNLEIHVAHAFTKARNVSSVVANSLYVSATFRSSLDSS